jgi:hypothetical protein
MIPVELLANAWEPLKARIKDPPIHTDTLGLSLEFVPTPPQFESVTASGLLATQYHAAYSTIKDVFEGEGMPAFLEAVLIVALAAGRFFGYAMWTIVNHLTGKPRTLEQATFAARVCNLSERTIDGILLDIEFPEQILLVMEDKDEIRETAIDHPSQSGVVRVFVEIAELRAHYCMRLPVLQMVCSHHRTSSAVWGDWRATSHSVEGSAGGPLEIPLSGKVPHLLPMVLVVILVAALPVWLVVSLVGSATGIATLVALIFAVPFLVVRAATSDIPRTPGA